MANFIRNDAEFVSRDAGEFIGFLKDREETAKWFTDEDGVKAKDVRFQAVLAEPICVPAYVDKLQKGTTVQFDASEEAYAEVMLAPEHGYNGSTQLIFVGGKLMPVGNSAIAGLLERSGLRGDGWKKLAESNPKELTSVLNSLLKATKGSLCILEQDEMVRAINSGKYAICPKDYVGEKTLQWMQDNYPNAEFLYGYACQDYARWIVNLDAYTNEIFKNFPELITQGFKPVLIVGTSDTGAGAVKLEIGVMYGGAIFSVGDSHGIKHMARGNASERTSLMQQAVDKAFDEILLSPDAAYSELDKLRTVKVSNAFNALKRAMKNAGIPKVQGMEAAELFADLFPYEATAFDCYLAVADALSFIIRDFPTSYQKHFIAAEAVTRAIKTDWSKLGNIPGDFSW